MATPGTTAFLGPRVPQYTEQSQIAPSPDLSGAGQILTGARGKAAVERSFVIHSSPRGDFGSQMIYLNLLLNVETH
ncbi:hypothetical protein EC9_21970 [Rosistilla ulvae]|uniref:Uncharacterized protein n=1 Tax=Rosistilla ulvae TaxID=1930277 RepID=A0A517LZG1_9BACT|nr:hypothetical protein EC9_21970 [Rosistilla ulvae]